MPKKHEESASPLQTAIKEDDEFKKEVGMIEI